MKNLSATDDLGWVGTALGELLATELSGDGTMDALPAELVQRMRLELQADLGELPRGPRLQQIRHNLGLDLVVWGSFQVTDPSPQGAVQLELHVIDAATGVSVAQEASAGHAHPNPIRCAHQKSTNQASQTLSTPARNRPFCIVSRET
jgi:hypothetical protein